ncbi:TlpA family protein disulfide reductase [Kaarinaea lacus]
MQHFLQYLLSSLIVLTSTATIASESNELHPLPEKPQATDFALQDIEGNSYHLKELRGKVVVINFWATWCPPCRYELPSMERAYQQLKKEDIVFVAINVGEDIDTIFTFTADYPVSFPLLLDLDSKTINSYPVVGLPTTFVIDKKGKLTYRAIGTREWDSEAILSTIKRLNVSSMH